MQRLFKALLPALLLLSTAAHGQQLHITKDHVACLYGLKNDSGRWVLPPTYTGMGTTSTGYFLALAGEKRGLLDSDGRLLISPVYEFMTLARPGWDVCLAGVEYSWQNCSQTGVPAAGDLFIAGLNDKSGLIDRHGKVKIPFVWDLMEDDTQGMIIARNDHKGVSLFDTSGSLIAKTDFDEADRFDGKPVTRVAILKRRTNYYGVIDRKGRVILPAVYDQVTFHNQLIVTQKGNEERLFDFSGREQLPFAYYRKTFRSREERYCESAVHSSDSGSVFRVQYNNDFYFVLNKGNSAQLLPEKYSLIIPLDTRPYKAQVWQNSLTGIVNEKGKFIIPLGKDSIQAVNLNEYSRGNSVAYFLVYTPDNHIGLRDKNCKVLLPSVYESTGNNWGYADGLLAFCKGKELVLFSGEDDSLTRIKGVELLAQMNDSFLLYRYGDKQLLVLEKSHNWISIRTGINSGEVSGDALTFVSIGSSYFILDKNMKLFMQPEQISSALLSFDHNTLKVETKSKHCGLLDMDLGLWLLDTVYADIDNRIEGVGYYWVKTDTSGNCPCPVAWRMAGNKSNPYRLHVSRTCNWYLINSQNRQRVSPVNFAVPFGVTPGCRSVWTNNGAALYNIPQHQLLTDDHYKDILMLNHNYFALIDTLGKITLTDKTGKAIDNRKWDSILPLQAGTSSFVNFDGESSPHALWLLSGSNGKALLDSKGNIFTDAVTIDSLRRRAVFSNSDETGTPYINQATDKELKASLLHAAGEAIAHYDQHSSKTISQGSLRRDNGNYPYKGIEGYQPDFNGPLKMEREFLYALTYVNPTCYSLLISDVNWSDRWKNKSRDYYSFRKTGTGYIPLRLDDIVNGNPELVFNNLLLDAIREDQRLKIGCSDNSRLFALTKGHFTISDEGIIFYFQQEISNSYVDTPVTLKWEKLKPFAKPGSIVFDFIKAP